jgi:serralysin
VGADLLDGGNGRDFASYSNSHKPVTASLAVPSINTGDATGDTYSNIEGLIGTSRNDTLIGDTSGNFLIGGGGGDSLDGGGGIDRASYTTSTTGLTANLADSTQNTGDAAGDTYVSIEALVGSNFDDVLIGDVNDNFLNGWAGADILTGGGGSDRFVFTATTDGVDTITDFLADDDTILLDNASFTALGTDGPLAADAFHIGPAAADASDRIIYDDTTGALYYDSDGNGVAAAIQFASMATGLSLTEAHFLVI